MQLGVVLQDSVLADCIASAVAALPHCQLADGLFPTYCIDFIPEQCPRDVIDESAARMIETLYDHAAITDILLKIPGVDDSMLKAAVGRIVHPWLQDTHDGAVRWRHYNIPHGPSGALILPDIDNTGRCLTTCEHASERWYDPHVENIIHEERNYRQLASVLWSVGDAGRPTDSFDPSAQWFALHTHFGHKPDNDIDPVCNITALISLVLFASRTHRPDLDVVMEKVGSYLAAFIQSPYANQAAFEYYEPPVLFYNYAMLIQVAENARPAVRRLLPITIWEESLFTLLMERIRAGWKNVFEAALLAGALLALGYRTTETDEVIAHIVSQQDADGLWPACRFYRQRHPYRIFGSRALTTAMCLQTLHQHREF